MQKYCLEFILHSHHSPLEAVKNSLAEFAENLFIAEWKEGEDSDCAGNFKITLEAEDPTVIFDICAQFGRIKSVKVSEATT